MTKSLKLSKYLTSLVNQLKFIKFSRNQVKLRKIRMKKKKIKKPYTNFTVSKTETSLISMLEDFGLIQANMLIQKMRRAKNLKMTNQLNPHPSKSKVEKL